MEAYKRLYHEGIELLCVRISMPRIEGLDAACDFWEQVAEAAYAFCTDRLLPYAHACYERDPDPKKRLRFAPFRYRLWGEITYRNEALLSLRLEATLSREGAGKERRCFCGAQNFSVPDGLLLSPRDALAQYWGKPVKKKQIGRNACLLLTDHAPLVLRDGAWVPL